MDNESLLHMHAQKLRDTWQARCLAEAKGKLAAVVLAVLAHSYANAIKIVLRVVFPGFRDIARPFLSSCATIMPGGRVVCDMVDRSGACVRNAVIFESEDELVREFRLLADKLKLSDADRLAMTQALKRWVVADQRIDHLGRKTA